MKKIYIFETRKLDYLQSYLDKANRLGFQPVVLDSDVLESDSRFREFKNVYQHLSCNSEEFEINCFARYFAIAATHLTDDTFILSDSDVYITERLKTLKDNQSVNGVFVGSEGFHAGGSEKQISPHFSFWNKTLINDFIDYTIHAYKRNQQDGFLTALYAAQQQLLGRTAISDMTLLYLWVNNNKVPFINSNSTENELGIDHNISAFYAADAQFKGSMGRKQLKIATGDNISCETTGGQRVPMVALHFQGGYKKILHDFYQGKFLTFNFFSLYINVGRKVNSIIRKG